MKKYKRKIIHKKTFNGKTYCGILQGNQRGFAFFICDECKDLFIPHRSLNGAQHGDSVKVRVVKGDEAEVISVIKRGITSLTGRIEKTKGKIFVIPDNDNYYTDIVVIKAPQKLQENSKVMVNIKYFDNLGRPQGEVVEVLGLSGDSDAETIAILVNSGFSPRFSSKVINEAKSLQKCTDYTKRKDCRHLLTITIDGEDAKDFDDAISVEKSDSGYTLYVHIADVSHFVKEGSEIDKEAYKRGTSVYFPNVVFPMLPERLSNDLCSLNPDEDKLALTACISFDKTGKRRSLTLSESVIRSKFRMNYKNIQKIIENDAEICAKYCMLIDFVSIAKELAEKIKLLKEKRGSLDFVSSETQIILDNEKVVEVKEREYYESNRIIEEFMIAANEAVASELERRKYPCIYRTHEAPKEEKIMVLEEYARSFGIEPEGKSLRVSEVSAFIKKCQTTEYAKLISDVAIRSMQKAEYRTDNIGHFGLASECYCHFTSPIRRYPDLVVHRMVKLLAKGASEKQIEEIEYKNIKVAAHSSQMERAAEKAERDVIDYYKTLYMSDHIGEEHEGIISGVTSFALFVMLDNNIEGYIPYEALPRDAYDYDPQRYVLKGKRNSYKLGDTVQIKVVDTNIYIRKVMFALCV